MKRSAICLFATATLLLLTYATGYCQVNYFFKVETGYMSFKNNTINVDPGPSWMGYYLKDKNSLAFRLTNGISYREKPYTGLGYLNFEGIKGIFVFRDFEYVFLTSKLSPILNLKLGHSHLWNQYNNGSGTALGELNMGLNFKFSEELGIYFKSGILLTQQSKLSPFNFGIRYR
ncbi:hypothetical protein FKX85_11495 [Echinicola soli]|uniref:Outer membrane protein beta-barrel domain-containing protein n=1 Tax=Echinicola soli TaxID=2591634 RepID=A0A514CIL8_9BACT|nr:hypothetical protein [Echinicola soli]QDH79626.1 hypothetical protein FKX85_11495 [Echinicola soli]